MFAKVKTEVIEVHISYHLGFVSSKGGNFIYPKMLRANFHLLSAVERAFEGFEGDFQRPEFQDAAHPR